MIGPKHKIQAEATAFNTSGPHDVGGLRPPSPHGSGRLLAAPSAFSPASIVGVCPVLYLMCLPHIVFVALCFKSVPVQCIVTNHCALIAIFFLPQYSSMCLLFVLFNSLVSDVSLGLTV